MEVNMAPHNYHHQLETGYQYHMHRLINSKRLYYDMASTKRVCSSSCSLDEPEACADRLLDLLILMLEE